MIHQKELSRALLSALALSIIFSFTVFDSARVVQAFAPSEGIYKVSASQSRFTVRAFAGGLLSALAHDHTISIREFTGEARFTYGAVEPASLQLTIKSASLAVTDKVSDSDRKKIEDTMRSEVLEVDKHPLITFKSTSISASRVDEGKYQTKISGDLTLHGTTRNVTFDAFVTFYEASLKAQGQFAIKQSNYGIKPVSVAGG
ncbi:MAG TPA: YceI family protein, partial [Blastocatellia bacterium]|nr:YceI family protein [Blastocatellia bacterium]